MLVEGLLEVSSPTSHAKQGHQGSHGGQVRRILPSSLPHAGIPHCGAFRAHVGGRNLNSNPFFRRARGEPVMLKWQERVLPRKAKNEEGFNQRNRFSVQYLDVFGL